jgi:aldehyde dehydrogenase (NAD+)
MLELAELFVKAGFPKGVVNVVTGLGPEVGEALVTHPKTAHIGFTGGDAAGRKIYELAARHLKTVTLELGGKSPNIVFSDADMAAAAQGALLGVFFNQGQVCCAGTRLFVEKKVHDDFVGTLAEAAKSMKQGSGLEADTRIGPLVSKEQLDRVTGYLDVGKKEGAKAVIGGERNTEKGLEKGYYVKPTIFTGVRNDMRIAREEIFGPVVSVIPFKDETDAVLQGNDTTYGLAAGLWTRDVSKAHRVARAIRAGTVWINCYNVFDPIAPFGGYKESGYGRELGKYALDLYTQVKSVWLKV